MNTSASTEKPRRPLSEKQLAARRANARQSTGPKTPHGKARSAQNALKHGFFAQTALLYYESPDDFVALRDAYIAEYNPQTPTEMHFVMEMANAQYRLRRVRGMEADLIQKLITRDLSTPGLSNGEIQAEALRTLADSSHVLHLLQRYEIMFRRQYERALHLLWEHRDRLHQPRQPRPQQPSPDTLHALLLAPTPQPGPPSANTNPSAQPSPITPAPQPPILRNEPKPAPTSSRAATSPAARRPSPAPRNHPASAPRLP